MGDRIRALARAHPRATVALLLGLLAVLLGAGLAATTLMNRSAATPQVVPSPTPVPPAPTPTLTPSPSVAPSPTPSETSTPAAVCPYDGISRDALGQVPVLVSIDNHPNARPATGLSAAEIVFENPVQGNSTRFVALFGCDEDAETVGPVRSGRWIQVDLWQQLHVLPILYGAAPYTTAYFADNGMPYIDGNVEAWPFFSRSPARPAPYNVYLDLAKLRRLLADDARLTGRVEMAGEPRAPFEFDEDWQKPESAREVSALTISTASYWSFGWRYNADASAWERIDGGSATTDAATGEPLRRRVVVVQRAVSSRTFADSRADADPPFQELTGSGTGTVYVDGYAIDVTWGRPNEDDATEWTIKETGEPLLLPPGPIWWEIIQTTASLVES